MRGGDNGAGEATVADACKCGKELRVRQPRCRRICRYRQPPHPTLHKPPAHASTSPPPPPLNGHPTSEAASISTIAPSSEVLSRKPISGITNGRPVSRLVPCTAVQKRKADS